MKIYIDPGYNINNRRSAADILIDDKYQLVKGIAETLGEILRSNGIDTLVSSPVPETDNGTARSVTAADRANEANNWGADYYIALQINSSNDPFDTGSEAYIYKPDSPAKPLAYSILERLNLATGLQNRSVTSRPDIYVLSRTNMPAVMVELGYGTNEVDSIKMLEHPEQFAYGIANGILAYVQGIGPQNMQQESARAAFFQLYPEARTGSCRLFISVSSGQRKQRPVSDADVTVFHGEGGKRLLVYRGRTDNSGRAIPVELPLYNDPNSIYDIQPQLYCICVRHPEYLPKNQWVTVTNQKNIRQQILLEEKRIR